MRSSVLYLLFKPGIIFAITPFLAYCTEDCKESREARILVSMRLLLILVLPETPLKERNALCRLLALSCYSRHTKNLSYYSCWTRKNKSIPKATRYFRIEWGRSLCAIPDSRFSITIGQIKLTFFLLFRSIALKSVWTRHDFLSKGVLERQECP